MGLQCDVALKNGRTLHRSSRTLAARPICPNCVSKSEGLNVYFGSVAEPPPCSASPDALAVAAWCRLVKRIMCARCCPEQDRRMSNVDWCRANCVIRPLYHWTATPTPSAHAHRHGAPPVRYRLGCSLASPDTQQLPTRGQSVLCTIRALCTHCSRGRRIPRNNRDSRFSCAQATQDAVYVTQSPRMWFITCSQAVYTMQA